MVVGNGLMGNLFLNISEEIIDFNSENFDRYVRLLKKFECSIDNLNKNKIDDLFTRMLVKKGDWASLSFNMYNNNFYVDINLIFHSRELSEEETERTNLIIEECTSFLREQFATEIDYNYCNLDDITEKINDDGLLVHINEVGGSTIKFEDLLDSLNKNGIRYEILNVKENRFEGGASGGSSEVVLFILGSIGSGMTWDMIKGVLTTKLNIGFANMAVKKIENVKFRKIRKYKILTYHSPYHCGIFYLWRQTY